MTQKGTKNGTKNDMQGEGNYEAARDYNRRTEEYLESADVTADARKAAPQSEAEKREMARAEAEGKRHAKEGGAKGEKAEDRGQAAMDSDDA